MIEFDKIKASINTVHAVFPKGKTFGYAAAIMTAGEYWNRFTSLDSAWIFTKPTEPETYEQSIKTLTTELKKHTMRRCGN